MKRTVQVFTVPKRMRTGFVFLFVVIALLAGCEEDQSAVPPGAVRELATTVADDPANDSVDDADFAGLPDADLEPETLPPAEHVYFTHGAEVWQITSDEDARVVSQDLTVASYSASATGERLAVLLIESSSDNGRDVALPAILAPDGEVLFDPSAIMRIFETNQISPIESVSLNPGGDALAMTHQNGAMTLVSLDGSVQQVMTSSIEHRPGRLSWSPDGRFIAYLDPWLPDEPSSLYVALPESEIIQAVVHASSDGHGVVRARWVPGTTSIAVSKSSGSTIPHGGDLFLVDVETGRQELLMSSGEIAPVGGVVDFAPSPDGEWLAVTGFVPGADFPGFAGLWIINLQSGLRIRPDMDGTVTNLWWLGDNLLVRTIDEPRTSLPGTYTGREEFQLLEINPRTGGVDERYPDPEPDSDDDDNDDDD